MSYYARLQAMGDFKPGDRVRIKPKYKGKTALSIAKRSGDWILKEFKTANWVLKRPDDYKGYYPQGLLAKSHMLEKVELKPQVGAGQNGIGSPTGLKPKDPPLQSAPSIHVKDKDFVEKFVSEMTKDSLKDVTGELMIESKSGVPEWKADPTYTKFFSDKKPVIKQVPDKWTPTPKKIHSVVCPPGTVVLVKDPEGKVGKGPHVMCSTAHEQKINPWVVVAPIFGGDHHIIPREYLTVIPKNDLKITYLPQ